MSAALSSEGQTSKLCQRKEMGWAEVHEEHEEAPLCEKQGRITKIIICRKCNSCGATGLCVACLKNGEKHYLVEDREDVYDFEEKYIRHW